MFKSRCQCDILKHDSSCILYFAGLSNGIVTRLTSLPERGEALGASNVVSLHKSEVH